MLTTITLFPGFLALLICILRTPEKAFFNVYLPVVIFIPPIVYFEYLGLPNLTFSQATIIPIFIFGILFRFSWWKFSITDLLITAFVGACVYSQYINDVGTPTLLADMLSNIVAPYILAKLLIQPANLTTKFARRYVWLLFVSVIVASFELRLFFNPFRDFLPLFFPDQSIPMGLLMRYGFARISGPFVQPILFAMGIGIAILLNYWLEKNRLWKPSFKYLPRLPVSKGWIMMLILIFGLIFTFSRGPLISVIIGTLIIGVGFSNHKFWSVIVRITLLSIFIAILVYSLGETTQIDPSIARTEEESTAAYRANLLNRYLDEAWKKPMWGWGAISWPKLPGDAGSIDNHYLFLFLKHGLVAVGLLVSIMIVTSLRLFLRGILSQEKNKIDSSLAFTFLAIIISLAIALASVFMGGQIEPIFFIIIGWSEYYLLTSHKEILNLSNEDEKIINGKKIQYEKNIK